MAKRKTKDQFLDCDQLGIPQNWRDALIWVLKKLEARKLPGKFNMNHWHHQASCGTVGCIGGWASTKLARDQGLKGAALSSSIGRQDGYHPTPLYRLFYPENFHPRHPRSHYARKYRDDNGGGGGYATITRKEGCAALRMFLEIGGNPAAIWRKVLKVDMQGKALK